MCRQLFLYHDIDTARDLHWNGDHGKHVDGGTRGNPGGWKLILQGPIEMKANVAYHCVYVCCVQKTYLLTYLLTN